MTTPPPQAERHGRLHDHEHPGWLPERDITDDCPLDCLFVKLTAGAYNILARELPRLLGHPPTVGDLATLHRQRQLSQFRGLGPRRVSEIETLLIVNGFDSALPIRPAARRRPQAPDQRDRRRPTGPHADLEHAPPTRPPPEPVPQPRTTSPPPDGTD